MSSLFKTFHDEDHVNDLTTSKLLKKIPSYLTPHQQHMIKCKKLLEIMVRYSCYFFHDKRKQKF